MGCASSININKSQIKTTSLPSVKTSNNVKVEVNQSRDNKNSVEEINLATKNSETVIVPSVNKVDIVEFASEDSSKRGDMEAETEGKDIADIENNDNDGDSDKESVNKSGDEDQEPGEQEPKITSPEEILENVKIQHEKVKELSSHQDDDGTFVFEVRKTLRKLSYWYFMKKFPLSTRVEYRRKIANLIIERELLGICHEVIDYTYRNGWRNEEGKKVSKKYDPFKFALLLLNNYTDASDELTVAVTNFPGLLETFKYILENSLENHLDDTLKQTEKSLLKWTAGIIHNLTMRDSNKGRCRELGLTNVLQPYLKSSSKMFCLNILTSLAGIVDEKECEIIAAQKDLVQHLFFVLGKSMKMKMRRYNGWSSKECAIAVRQLALNDANKSLLVELGALELLVELGKKGNREEQYEAIQAIWALTFDEDNRQKIVCNEEIGVIDLLVELKTSENRGIVKGCHGALWNLQEEMKKSSVEKFRQIALEHEAEMTSRRSAKKGGRPTGHIMLSYQWADQKTLIRIKEALQAAGYKVWMDIDQMGGSTLQAMAEAVENASIVLVSMSNKYKNSPNCRAEAEYAFQKKKIIIPLKLERGYNPDGWLGFIIGAKLFFEFTDKYPFDQKMQGLLKEIQRVCNRVEGHAKTETTTSVSAAPVGSTTHPPPATTDVVTRVRDWTTQDVQNWINKNHLQQCGINNWTGGEIAFLLQMRMEAPEFFYRCLQDYVKVKDLLTLSRIFWAMNDLKGQV